MPLEFVHVRRIDDHATTAKVGRSALQHMPGWELAPDEPEPEPAFATGGVDEPTSPAGEQPPSEPESSTRSKSRRPAATENKE